MDPQMCDLIKSPNLCCNVHRQKGFLCACVPLSSSIKATERLKLTRVAELFICSICHFITASLKRAAGKWNSKVIQSKRKI